MKAFFLRVRRGFLFDLLLKPTFVIESTFEYSACWIFVTGFYFSYHNGDL